MAVRVVENRITIISCLRLSKVLLTDKGGLTICMQIVLFINAVL